MIPIAKPYIDEYDLDLIKKPLLSGSVVQGKYVKEFENLFSGFSGIDHCVASTSCTTALHLITSALGLKPGDEVLVPSFTWVATANCVEYVGAKPVFVDISLDTFNMNPNEIERQITDKTKAIIPVHLFGLCADMTAIMEIALSRNLRVIEDAACAFDSWYKGKHAGSFGSAAAFSFHPRKAITTGEGGMVATSDQKFAEKIISLRNHGAEILSNSDNKDFSFLLPDYTSMGFNYRMTDIQGALGVSQMQKAKEIMKSKRKAVGIYQKKLEKLEWLQLPFQHPDFIHGFQSFVCLYKPQIPTLGNMEALFGQRNRIMHNMEKQGIETRQGTHSIAHTKFYNKKYNIPSTNFSNSIIAEKCSIALPLFAGISEEEIDFVVTTFIKEFEKVST